MQYQGMHALPHFIGEHAVDQPVPCHLPEPFEFRADDAEGEMGLAFRVMPCMARMLFRIVLNFQKDRFEAFGQLPPHARGIGLFHVFPKSSCPEKPRNMIEWRVTPAGDYAVPPFENSPFILSDRPVTQRGCDCPGCIEKGDYRAPKSRDNLHDYYWFCLDHVREYNKQWDYFAGMGMDDIEAHIRKAAVWDRPTWPIGAFRAREQQIRDEIAREFFPDEALPEQPQPTQAMSKAERDALTLLELLPPVDFAAIKAQYRILVKRHHPDANGGSPQSEETFKNINQAFAVLKQIYGTEET